MKLRLIFNGSNVDKPILSKAILRTGVPVNILEAKISPSMGELTVDVPAEGTKLKELISILKERGVLVKEITKTIEIDREICIPCGACVSACSFQALRQTPDWDIDFDEEKCVACRVCIHACPVNAIQAL